MLPGGGAYMLFMYCWRGGDVWWDLGRTFRISFGMFPGNHTFWANPDGFGENAVLFIGIGLGLGLARRRKSGWRSGSPFWKIFGNPFLQKNSEIGPTWSQCGLTLPKVPPKIVRFTAVPSWPLCYPRKWPQLSGSHHTTPPPPQLLGLRMGHMK